MQNQTADVAWKANGVPVSTRFDDPYFSLEDGLAETRHVFLHGNGLPERFVDGFHIAELGFGTGLSFLATLRAWQQAASPGRLIFTSFEAFPLRRADLHLALEPFEDLGDLRDLLTAQWHPVGGRFEIVPGVCLELVIGDARETVPPWTRRADAWYLDGFAPAKNPELWSETLMQEVGAHTAVGGTFATYTAAGFVRRALDGAGFDVRRVPGFGRKRHMSTGVLRS
ncbi:tRNA (5-methylaminomethyl-2-thiouridine)(34)-methyltransferase MnmD [Roseobacter sinensis]|uniref:tRNA (5-methylaminomethyl-2-thiouridine)(34)-methyltransferase MnmD n=1 Tax=Roseobacter sinensis TaxID=2931391 RepID=A0ABT3BDJ7_9RHOB|nr:tRNA (5-methylaminomethyl-2-thiouridine)(34)-methyltransferase MnmD [Roseobacter sp. WL0113]MCV3271648.1 tRNA (5-methylaminomethyl-2-thiouridine)(34)-methyltransferase MnmD [Roseobacter sp. WL0113]